MATKFRNVSADERLLHGYGVMGSRRIPADGILTVHDDTAASYECQPSIWRKEVALAPAPTAPAPAPAPAKAEEANK